MKSKKTVKAERLSFNSFPIYLFRRPYQSSIRMNIKMNGEIHLSASKGMDLKDIFNFLEKSQKWIQKTMEEIHNLKEKYPLKKYVQNESFLFLGEKYKLKFYPSLVPRTQIKIENPLKEFKVLIPERDWNATYLFESKPRVRAPLLEVYKNYGKDILFQSVKFYAQYMNLQCSKVSFRCQKTRWGSCSPSGNISLNWRLVVAPVSVLNYVVIHELAHLKYLDHSNRFWNLVERFCPNYKVERNWLNQNQYEMDFLAPHSELHSDFRLELH